MSEYETMIYQREGKVGYLMFNRPQSLNAVNDQFEQDLQDALLWSSTSTKMPGCASSTAPAAASAPGLTSSSAS